MSKTFYDWCIENKRNDYIEYWDYDKNESCPSDYGIYSKRKIWMKCTRGIHKPRFISIGELTNSKKSSVCTECNSFAQWGIDKYGDDFLDRYWDYERNIEIDPWKISRSSGRLVYIKCNKVIYHGSYEIKCNTFVSAFPNSGCKKCHVRGKNGKPAVEDSIAHTDHECIKYWSCKNSFSPYDVSKKSHKLIWWKCPDGKHGDYLRNVAETRRYNYRCPHCVNEMRFSSLQRKVSNYLENDLGFSVNHEYECTINPPSPTGYNNLRLPYDNEIVDLKLIIEVNGSQHYKPNGWMTTAAKRNKTTPDYELSKQIERDKYKKDYAIKNGYQYLEIPYYEEENDLYKISIQNKIKEITTQNP